VGVQAGLSLPFYIAAAGIMCSIVGAVCVRTNEGASQDDLLNSMRGGTFTASALILLSVRSPLPPLP
jgi:Na+/H+-translocating membrane pyrophosphatase